MADSKLKIDIRRERILELLRRDGRVQVSRLSEELGATPVTIRSDLAALEQAGRLLRMPGGAILPDRPPAGSAASQAHGEEKQAVAAAAAALVASGDTLFINSGTTAQLAAEALRERRDLNIVTNSVSAALTLGQVPSFRVLLLGGEINALYGFTSGGDAQEQLGRYQADWAILSVDGISAAGGITTYHAEEAPVVRMMSSRAKRTIVAADHSKIGRPGFTRVRDAGPDVCLVTTAQAGLADRAALEEAGVQIVLC